MWMLDLLACVCTMPSCKCSHHSQYTTLSNICKLHLLRCARDTIRDTWDTQAHPNLPQVEQCGWKLNKIQTQLVPVLFTTEPIPTICTDNVTWSVNQENALVDKVVARQDWAALTVVGVTQIVLIPAILLELKCYELLRNQLYTQILNLYYSLICVLLKRNAQLLKSCPHVWRI